MSVLWFLIVGVVSGLIAGLLVKGGGFGLVGDLVVGVIGAILGGFLFGLLGVKSPAGIAGSIAVSTVGAVVFLVIARVIQRA